MKTLRHLVIAASAAMLAACATTTPYQPASKPGGFDGYSQTMLDNSTARVTFGGNSLTNRETVENYLLYRAAEMAVERGHEYFSLVNQDTEKNTRVSYNPRPGYGYGAYGDPYFRYSFFQPRRGWTPFNRYSFFRRGIYRNRGFGFMGYQNDPFYRNRFDDQFNTRESTKYRASAQVAFGRSAPGSDHVFNAREILANLGPSIVFPEQG